MIVIKINKHIKYEDILYINDTNYKLIGLTIHNGGLGGGHYYSIWKPSWALTLSSSVGVAIAAAMPPAVKPAAKPAGIAVTIIIKIK